MVLEAKNGKALEEELKAKKIKFSGAKRLRVDLNGKSAQAIIHKIKTPLSYLDIHNPTLEEAYLDLIETEDK